MRVCKWLLVLTFLNFIAVANAANYTLPQDAINPPNNSPFGANNGNCSWDGGTLTLTCLDEIDFGNNNDTVTFTHTGQMLWKVDGDFNYRNGFKLNEFGDPENIIIEITGSMNLGGGPPGNNSVINAILRIGGSFNIANNTSISGSIQVEDGDLNVGQNSTVSGNLDVNGNVTVDNNATIDGNVNSTGTVTNDGTVTGYVNAPEVDGGGDAGEVCDVNDNEGPCFGGFDIEAYEVTNPGTGFTCEAMPLTVRVCATGDCSSLSAEEVSLSVEAVPDPDNPNGAVNTFSTGTQTFTESESFLLTVPEPGTYQLEVSSTIPADSGYFCLGPNGCTVDFVDTGFRITTAPASVVAGDSFTINIQSIRTDSETGACEAAVEGAQEIDFSLQCLDPNATAAACSNSSAFPDARLVLNGMDVITGHNSAQTLSTTFDASGLAQLSAVYRDVGEISFSASLPVSTGVTLSGISQPVIVYPGGFRTRAYLNGDLPPAESDTTDFDQSGVFARAGEMFRIEIEPVTSDGLYVTPSFGYESIPASPHVSFGTLLAPDDSEADGTASTGTLSGASAGSLTLESPGLFSSNTVSWTEAGVFSVNTELNNSAYLSVSYSVSTLSDPIGRFIPAYLDVAVTNSADVLPPEDIDEAARFADGHEDFTYLGQPFEWLIAPNVEIMARTMSGTGLNNYTGSLFKLDPTDAGDSFYTIAQAPAGIALDDITVAIGDVDVSGPEAFGEAGSLILTDTRQFERPVTPELPFNPLLDITLAAELFTDSDGVCFSDGPGQPCDDYIIESMGGTQQVTGRLNLLPAYGPSEAPLPLQFQTELFACSGSIAREDVVDVNGEAIACSADDQGWRRNLRDITGDDKDATAYSVDWLTEASLFVARPEADSGLVGALDFSSSPLVTEFLVAGRPEPGLELVVESGGLRGIVDWELDLDDAAVALPWLKHDWNESSTLSNPSTELEFGISSENRRILFQRETGW